MGEPRLSKILIGTLFIGLISLGFMLFLNAGATIYNVPGHTESVLSNFTATSNDVEDIANSAGGNLSTTGAGADSGFDIFGSFFSNAWTALKSTWSSISTISTLGTQAIDNIPIINDTFRKQLNIFLTVSVLIIIIIGIFFHFIKPSNRL